MMAPLVNLVVPKEAAETMRAESREWPSWYLNARQLSDLELLSCGAFSPLTGFLSRLDYDSVVRNQRLDAGTPWPIPIVLDVTESFAATVTAGKSIALRDPEGVMLAALRVQDMWLPDLRAEADAVFGGTAHESPDASILSGGTNPVYLGGPVHATQLPTHYDYRQLRLTPAQVRAEFARRGWSRVMALQSCHLIHRARQEATMRAAREVNAKLLIQALVGGTSPGDVEHYSRIRCYQATIGNYPPDTAMMCLVPMAPRCTGPREALWRGIISRNYGCTHVAFGAALSEPDVTPERDQAEPSNPP